MMDFFNTGQVDWYTIDTLEKLCYEKEVAPQSFKILYSLANRDNILKDRATAAFIDLFQVVLAETVLNLEERLEILNKIEEEEGLSSVIIGAYERTLKSYGFIGHLNSGNTDYKNKQFTPFKKEQPKKYINEYYSNSIEKLRNISLAENDELASQARKSLIFRMQEQITGGAADVMLNTLEEIVQSEGAMSDDIRQKLTQINSERYRLDEEINNRINELLDKYKPQGIKEELEAFVINAPWVNIRNESGDFTDVSKTKAIGLANKYLEENKDWLSEIKVLLCGEQRQTFSFAETLGSQIENRDEVLLKIIEYYKKIEKKNQNSIFLIGFLSGVNDDDFTRSSISLLSKSECTEIHAIRIIKLIKNLTYDDLLSVKKLLLKNPAYLINLEYLNINNLNNEEIKLFVDWLKDIDHSSALQFLYEILRTDASRWDNLKDKINELLWVDDILNFRSSINTTLHIEDLISNSLRDDPSKNRIAFLVDKIIVEYGEYSMKNDALLHRLTYMLLEEYWELSWPIFGDYIANNKNESTYSLNYYMERYKYKNELLFLWAEKDPNYPPVAMKFMVIYKKEEDDLKWDVFAKKFIMKYGDDERVLDNLSSKFINYSISGYSAKELYTARKELVIELLDTKLEKLKVFAQNMIEALERYIKEEERQRENYELDN